MKEMVGGCCVCSDERGWAENPLVYCDGQGCNVAVHQACYGIVTVPTGPWFCRKCESQERTARVETRRQETKQRLTQLPKRCELCPSKDGALKRTDNGGWAHVVCALYIPEVRFGNVTTMEPIILQLVPQDRFNKTCYLCEEQGKESKATIGACMQCNKSGCKQHFHVTCAQAAGLLCEEAGNYMDNVKYCGYCQYHYQKLKKGSTIKPIPAFKPIPADNATPDSTPEKNSPPHDLKERGKPRTEKKTGKNGGASSSSSSSVITETVSTISFSDSSNSCSSTKPEGTPSNGATGKFTTANFTETVITHSGSVFGSAEKNPSKKSKKSSNCITRVAVNPALRQLECPMSSGADDEACLSASDTGSEMTKPFHLNEMNAENSLCVSSSVLGATPSGTFTSAYENFLSGSYPGITSSDNDPPIGKRQRSQSAERVDKKRHRKGNGNVSKKARKKREVVVANGIGSFAHINPSSLPNGLTPHHLTPNQLGPPSSPAESPAPVGTTEPTGSNPNREVTHPDTNAASPTSNTSNSSVVGPGRSTPGSRTPGSINNITQFPQNLEQLLERQWDQGSQFLMEQAQHFDIASLLSCLHQLRMENQRLEEHVSNLISRRDHLLAVNARLSVSLNSPNSVSNMSNAATDGSRLPRINNYIPIENGVPSPQEVTFHHRIPSQGSSPAHATISSMISSSPSPQAQPMVSLISNLPSHSPSIMQTPPSQTPNHQSPSLTASPGRCQGSPGMHPSPNIRRSPAAQYIPSVSPIGQPPVARNVPTPEQLRMHPQLVNRSNLGPFQRMRSTFQPPPPPPPSTMSGAYMPIPVFARPNWNQQSQSPYPMYPVIPSSFSSTASSAQHNSVLSTPVSVVTSLATQQPAQHSSQQQVIQQHSTKRNTSGCSTNLPEKR